jgi:hypothetical protein
VTPRPPFCLFAEESKPTNENGDNIFMFVCTRRETTFRLHRLLACKPADLPLLLLFVLFLCACKLQRYRSHSLTQRGELCVCASKSEDRDTTKVSAEVYKCVRVSAGLLIAVLCCIHRCAPLLCVFLFEVTLRPCRRHCHSFSVLTFSLNFIPPHPRPSKKKPLSLP